MDIPYHFEVKMLLVFCLVFLVSVASCSEESESRLLRNYLPEFLNKINPNIWIENYVNNVFDSRLHREDIKQTALFNVVKCLVIDDRNNCKSLLEIAEHMYREIPPATVSPNKGDHDVTETTSQ